jgi:hypothetical protein
MVRRQYDSLERIVNFDAIADRDPPRIAVAGQEDAAMHFGEAQRKPIIQARVAAEFPKIRGRPVRVAGGPCGNGRHERLRLPRAVR